MSPPTSRNSGVRTWKVLHVYHRKGISPNGYDSVCVSGEDKDGSIAGGSENRLFFEQVSHEHAVLFFFPNIGPQGPCGPPFPNFHIEVPIWVKENGRFFCYFVPNILCTVIMPSWFRDKTLRVDAK